MPWYSCPPLGNGAASSGDEESPGAIVVASGATLPAEPPEPGGVLPPVPGEPPEPGTVEPDPLLEQAATLRATRR
jgi:hypothetical protein